MRLLDGTTPLWNTHGDYLRFITEHDDEVWQHHDAGDENARLIVDILMAGFDVPERWVVLMVAVERYIHDHHPDIATIEGGYPAATTAARPPRDEGVSDA